MRERIRLALALFRTSWMRSVSTVLGIAAITAMASSIMLVLGAFDQGVRDQLGGAFHQRNRIVLTQTGGPMTQEQIREILGIHGVDGAIPVAQIEGSVNGERAVVLVVPGDEENTSESDDAQVWLSSPLRMRMEADVGSQARVRLDAVELNLVVGPDPTAQGYPEFDKSAYAVVTSSALQQMGHREMTAANLVFLNAPDQASADALDRVVAKHPGLAVQDRETADAGLRVGIKPILENLPLVALVALLLGVVLVFTIIRAAADSERASLGLLRALGASARRLRGLAIASGILHGAAGCALGLLLAAPAASALMDSIPASSRNSAAPVPHIPLSPAVYTTATLIVLGVSVLAARSGARPIVMLSAEDQFRGSPERKPKWRSWLLAGIGCMATGTSILLTLTDARQFGFLGMILVLAGWASLSPVLIAAMLGGFDRVTRRSGAGFVSRSSDQRVARQMRSASLVLSGALVLLVSLSGLATNLRESTEPTLAGMGDIDLMVQDAALDDLPTTRNISSEAEKRLAGLEGVSTVRPIQMGYLTYRGTRVLIQGVDPESELPVVQQGTARGGELASGEAYVSTQFARLQGINAGDEFTLARPDGDTTSLTAKAVVDSFLWPGGLVVLNVEDSRWLWPNSGASAYEVTTEGGWGQVRQEILRTREALALPGTVMVASGPDQADQARKVVDDSSQLYQALAMIGLFVAMLLAASAIALDTSARLKEFGIIRALGGRSRFLASMVMIRAALLVAPAAIVGGAFGVLLLWATTETSASSQGMSFGMHWSTSTAIGIALACVLVVAVAAGGSVRLVTKQPAPAMLGASE